MNVVAVPSSADLPVAHGDDLATVVVRRLEQRGRPGSWGLMKTVLLGVPSLGLLPLLAWPARFRDFLADESLAMQELAQWAKLRGRQPAAVGPLLATAEETAVSPLPFVISLVIAALVVGVFAIEFTHIPFSLDELMGATYAYTSHMPGLPFGQHREFIYEAWVTALCIGYGVQWVHVRAHLAKVRRFVERFNPIVEAEGLPPVKLSSRGHAYFRPIWILAAVILCIYGAWWGIPMILAGMAQKRYTSVTARWLHRDLALRVRDIVMLRNLPMRIASTTAVNRCTNPRCLAPLKSQGQFCTRCGSSIQQPEMR